MKRVGQVSDGDRNKGNLGVLVKRPGRYLERDPSVVAGHLSPVNPTVTGPPLLPPPQPIIMDAAKQTVASVTRVIMAAILAESSGPPIAEAGLFAARTGQNREAQHTTAG